MSQDPPPGEPRADDRTLADPPASLAARGETVIGAPAGAAQDEDAGGSGSAPRTLAEPRCPNCAQPLEPGSRFCQSCGQELATGDAEPAPAAQPTERLRPWFAVVVLAWLVIMVAALYFIYGWAMMIGSP